MIKEKYDQFFTYTQALIWYGFYQSIKGGALCFFKNSGEKNQILIFNRYKINQSLKIKYLSLFKHSGHR